MSTLHRGLITATLLFLAACEARETRAQHPTPGPDAPPPPVVRTPAAAANVETTVEPPAVQAIETMESAAQDAPAPASAELLAQAIAGVEARASGLRALASELRAAVDALGENATEELREGASAVASHLAEFDQRFEALRSASAEKLSEVEREARNAADELERRTATLKALLP